MKLLSLALNHDTGAAAYSGLAFEPDKAISVNEERFIRQKLTRKFPYHSIRIMRMKKPDKLLISGQYTPALIFRLLNFIYHRFRHENSFSILLQFYILYQRWLSKNRLLRHLEISLAKSYYSLKLDVPANDIILYDHHKCHAASAFYGSGHDRALVVTLDMMGDALTTTVSIGRGKSLKKIYSQDGMNGLALFYAKITQALGFRPSRHEGKITGLAAYGKPDKKLLNRMKSIFKCRNGRFTRQGLVSDRINNSFYRSLKSLPRETVAATAQYHLEIEVSKFVDYWLRKTGESNVCLAGGTFANVKLNQRIHELESVKNIFIFPHMGDGGLAYGALMNYMRPEYRIEHMYLGPEYSDNRIRRALENNSIRCEFRKDIEKDIARLISEGRIIGRFNGRMEFGPRALGNRSILCEATDPDINDWLNRNLNRTEFMPFAPVVMDKHIKKCFYNTRGAEHAAKFMTITFRCHDIMKKKCPGVVHVDGTARPQVISKKDNPSYYRILEEYYKLTKIPAIINTSFNMHEEPIVCTPEDAVRSFTTGKLDYLAIGSYLARRL